MNRRRATSSPPPPEPTFDFDDLGDAFPGASASSAIPVSLLARTMKEIVEGAFTPLWIRGEVTDVKVHRNGHWYFCIRDSEATIRCVVWSKDAATMAAAPDEGMQVTARGRVTVYTARGEVQFTVLELEAQGDGLRRKALEQARKRLEADGLLAPERKRPLPLFPATIAVITSPDGAALRDIIAVVRKRGASTRIVVVPAAVQGENAPRELRAAVGQVARWGGADLLIIGRGGGSQEDLRAFDNERVARAVAASPIPTISAVGHEIDISLCDLVADVRAPTPSAAAEHATRGREELVTALRGLRARLGHGMERRLTDARRRLGVADPAMTRAMTNAMRTRRARLASAAGHLEALSPVATLARGYSVIRGPSGETFASVEQFGPGEPFDVLLRDGIVSARAESVQNARALDSLVVPPQ